MKKTLIFSILLIAGFWFIPLASLALTISPAKIMLDGNPGDVLETKMTIRNDLDRILIFYPSFQRFTTRGEEPIFLADQTDLASWITTDPVQVTLNYNQQANIKITVRIPQDAEPGGHYAAIFWSSAAPGGEGGSGVSIVTKVGALVLLDVSGDTVESAQLERFGAEKTLFSHKPVSFTYTLENVGTVHLEPVGQIVIKNIFGRTAAVLAINPAGTNILPGTERTVSAANFEPEGGMPKIEGDSFWSELKREKEGFALGYYRANLNLEYGKKEIQTLKAGFGFWVFPWRIIMVSLLGLGILLLLLTKGVQKYNQWIIGRVRASLLQEKKK